MFFFKLSLATVWLMNQKGTNMELKGQVRVHSSGQVADEFFRLQGSLEGREKWTVLRNI